MSPFNPPPAKKKKTNNFASSGRVIGTGAVKPARHPKKAKDDDDDDYVPPAETTSEDVESGVDLPTRSKKRKLRLGEDEDEAFVPEGLIPIVERSTRPLRLGRDVRRALGTAGFKVAEEHVSKYAKADDEEKGEKIKDEPETESADRDEVVESEEIEKGALRGGRNRDAFLNKYGKGQTL